MHAWRVHGFGEPADELRLDEIPEPTGADLAGMGMGLPGWIPLGEGVEPFDDWVVLDMRAAGLALPDVTMCRGTYPVPVGRPYVSGQEGVGVVVEAAPRRSELLGKRVAAVTMQPFGSLAPVAVGISTIFEVPSSMSDTDAAGYLIAAHTAYHAVVRRGAVQAGETVVVLGAAGGLGSAITQLCIAAGARVLAVVGGDEKAAFCSDLGAEPIDHHACDPIEAIRSLTESSGVQVLADPVQGDAGATMREVLAPDGRHILCGHAGGLVDHGAELYLSNHTLVGATLGGYGRARMREIHAEAHEALSGLLADGRYRPTVHRVVDFDQVPEAVTAIAARRAIGRTVVRMPN